MSGTDAAATLTLRIDTGQAKADLELLKKEYGDLLAVMRAPATGKGVEGIGADAKLAAQQIDTLTKQVATLQAKMAAGAGGSGLMSGYSQSFGGFSTSLKIAAADTEEKVGVIKTQLKSLGELQRDIANRQVPSAFKVDRNFAAAGGLPSDAQKAFEASVQYDKAWQEAQALNRARRSESTISQWKDEEATAKMELAEIRRIQGIKDYVNQVILAGAIAEKARREEVQKAWDTRKAKRSLASAESTISQWKDEEATAKMELDDAKRITALKEKEALEVAKWAALDKKARASATLRAARVIYSGADQSALPGVDGSSQAREAALRLGSLAAADAAYRSLSPATKESAASQIHWNKVANEGHAAARGLAGSLGTLWITYGSLIPLLAGATIGSAFINAAKAGSEFAYQLTFVKALGGESAEAVQKLSDAALSLSQTGLRGPTEIASGFRILAQAGLDASEALEAMPQTLNLATVGEMEMEQAAVTLVGVMKAFNLTVKDSERVGDVFAKAAALSQTSVQGMTEAMKTASVVGEQYGANLEDTATAITLLAKVNITGTAAGTSFRNMLKELYAPVPQSAKAMENLGLKTKDAEGNLRNFADVIYDLKGRLSDFSKGDQVEILQRLFGERGAKEAVAMLALTKDKWVELRDEIKNSKGFMEGVATELENTAKGKWAQAINTMKVQLVTAFNEMEPIFSQLADNLKALFADPAFLQNLKAIVGGMASLTNAVIEMAPHLITLAQAWVVYKAAMITAAVWTATSTAVAGFATSMQIASGIMGPALGPMASMKAIVAGLPSLLMAIPTPLTIIAGGLAAGAVAWTIWGNNASRAGDKAYDAAVRASAALDKVSRREKYGVGDLGEAQEELDKAEKLLSLRVEGRATGTALSDARESVAKWGKVVEGLEREKYKASNASEGLKAAVAGETKKPTRKASEILGSEGRGAGGSGRGALKDARSILNDNLESGLKQEKIQLGRELIEIEIDLAAQTISTTVATEKKNQATMASLEIERLLIEASLADAKAAGDKVQVEKFLNDLAENSLKLEKQQQQALLDTTKARTANRNAIDDLSVSTSRYIDDLQFEQIALDKTAQEVSQLRIEREQLRAVEDLQRRVDRNQVDPEVAKAERGAIDAKAAAQMQDQEFQRSYVAGWKKAHKAYVDDATNAAKMAADSYQAMSSAIEGALDEFLTTGKLNFAKFAQSVILDIAKIEAKALAAKAMSSIGGGEGGFGGIVNGILGMFGGGGGGFSSGDFANLAASFIDSAKGNVFSGSPSLHAYANTVQTSPKTFAFQNLHGFAKGGIFAEAGPEAVMPLKRDSYGRLGVQAEGGDGKVINITVNINGNNNNPQDVRRAAGQGAREAMALLNSARRYA